MVEYITISHRNAALAYHCFHTRISISCFDSDQPWGPLQTRRVFDCFLALWPNDCSFSFLIFRCRRNTLTHRLAPVFVIGSHTSREQFLHCGLRKFRHSKSSVYRRYLQLVRGRFVYDTYRTMKATWSHHGWVHMFITHRSTVTLQLHNFDLFRTCRTSSFCVAIVARQLARFQLTRRIARSLGDSWAFC